MKLITLLLTALLVSPVFASNSLDQIYSNQSTTVINPVEFNKQPVLSSKANAASLCASINSNRLISYESEKIEGASYNTIQSKNDVIWFNTNKQVKATLMLKSVTCAN